MLRSAGAGVYMPLMYMVRAHICHVCIRACVYGAGAYMPPVWHAHLINKEASKPGRGIEEAVDKD